MIQNQNALSKCESRLFSFILDIRYLTFAVKVATYRIVETLDIKNVETRAHSIIARRRIMIKKVKTNVIT